MGILTSWLIEELMSNSIAVPPVMIAILQEMTARLRLPYWPLRRALDFFLSFGSFEMPRGRMEFCFFSIGFILFNIALAVLLTFLIILLVIESNSFDVLLGLFEYKFNDFFKMSWRICSIQSGYKKYYLY